MEKLLRAGILGMGNMGKAHAVCIRNLPGAELAAVCSAHRDTAQVFLEEQGLSCPVYEDSYLMIEEIPMDMLFICLPPFAHNGQLEAAAEKGIHIFIEKPIALSMERAQSMVRAAAQGGIHTQVGYQMRFGGAVQKLKELMDQGITGRPTLYTASYECNSLHCPWWRDIKTCGGQVFEQVIHLYDMGMYLMGNPVEVYGHTANLCHGQVEGYTVEDTSISNLIFENGALGSITGSNCGVKNQWNGRFRVIFEHLVADFTDPNHATFTFTDEEEARIQVIEEEIDATMEEDRYFLEVVKGKQPPFATLQEGLTGLWMVSRVVESCSPQHT